MIELWQITSKTFVAGFLVRDGEVIARAPVLYKVLGDRDLHRIKGLCLLKGWRLEKVQ